MKNKKNPKPQLHLNDLYLAGLIILLLAIPSFAQTNWVPLFNGNDLSAFEKRNGTAEYKVEGNQIIGTSKLGSKSTYLCTKKRYSDFILEVDVKIEVGLNSGIQFRSNSVETYKNAAVHGYQAEMEASGSRKWSGGIFDQGRRGWVYPVTMNEPGREAFKTGTWNKYRIEAVGNSIRTWVNGVQVTNLVDDMTAEGFIAFQVHSIKNKKEKDGLQVRWRDARILTENLEENQWPLEIIPKERAIEMEASLPQVPETTSDHYANFLLACMGKEKSRSSFDVAGPLSQVFNLGVLAQRLNIKLSFDRETKQITNNPLANMLLTDAQPRKGWEEYYKL
jgi:hypothetical protein